MRLHSTRSLFTLLAAGATLAACASPSNSGGGGTDAAEEAPAAERESTATPQPRLVIASDSGAEVVGGQDLASLSQYDLASRPKLQMAGDDRHVFVLQSDAGTVGVVDPGSWTEAHGDHGHSYVTDPSLLDTTFDDGTSYHVVSDDERSVVWFDDDGSFQSFDWKGLEDDDIDVQRVETGAGHHGVAAPTADGGFLASYPEGEDAAGVLVLDEDGTETNRIEGCAGLHGEAHAGDEGYAFGCSDGVLVVEEGEGATIDSPVEGAGTRALFGAHDSDVLVGNLTSESDDSVAEQIALYDLEAGSSTAVGLGVEFSGVSRADGQSAVVGTDGAAHVLDDATGEVVEKIDVMEPWEMTDDYTVPTPQIAIGGGFAWVTDPRDSSIALFELGTGEERTRSTLADVPTSMMLVNG
ncbi:hypothetical protein [Aeromicrobium sp. CF3.5]|uniref:hypothetical protein n=1 Tax=Aeromicrobium sp. CF3.5 TaxID=3373078 RepID=UPI003EE630F7